MSDVEGLEHKEMNLVATGRSKEEVMQYLASQMLVYLNIQDMVEWREHDEGWEGTLPIYAEFPAGSEKKFH